jgi:uncharacterized repeat protein (TIGR03943 family)
MRFKYIVENYKGVILIAITSIATIWLGATNQLGLYIHPRYFGFSLVACTIGLVAVAYALSIPAHKKPEKTKLNYASLFLIIFAFVSLVLIKPTTLSSDIANQRGINSASTTEALSKLAEVDIVSPFGDSSYTQLTIKDWANLLAQTSDQAFFVNKKAIVSGFITQDESDPDNRFFVSRFVLSCCAVDARPIGVPLYLSNWKDKYQTDQWIAVEGEFSVVEGKLSLNNPKIESIDKPRNPYVY